MATNPSLSTTPRPGYVFFPFDVVRSIQVEIRPEQLEATAHKIGGLLDKFESKHLPKEVQKILKNDLGLDDLLKIKGHTKATEQIMRGLSFVKPLDSEITNQLQKGVSNLVQRDEKANSHLLQISVLVPAIACTFCFGFEFTMMQIFFALLAAHGLFNPMINALEKLDDSIGNLKSNLESLLADSQHTLADSSEEWIRIKREFSSTLSKMEEICHYAKWPLTFFKYSPIRQMYKPELYQTFKVNNFDQNDNPLSPADGTILHYEIRIREMRGFLMSLPQELPSPTCPFR